MLKPITAALDAEYAASPGFPSLPAIEATFTILWVLGMSHHFVVSILLFFQIATGLLLFAWIIGTGPASWLQPIVSYFPGGIQGVRMLHYLVTFLFFAFLIHHVYSAILVDIEERTGVMTSIFTGFKSIRPHSTADYLTDEPGIGDDAQDARTIAEQSGPGGTSKIDA